MAGEVWLYAGEGFEMAVLKNTPRLFRAHFHDYWLVGGLFCGSHRVWLRNAEFCLDNSCLLVLNAGEVHACRALVKGGVWGALQIHADFLPALKQGGERFFHAGRISHPGLLRDFAALLNAQAASGFTAAARSLRNLLLNLAECSRDARTRGSESPAVWALPKMESLPCPNPSLTQMANAAKMEKYGFAHRFARQQGIPPHRYVVNLRLIEARKLLSAGASLADVALKTGFYDQAHFSRAFKTCMGYTPGQYRRLFLQGN